MSENRHECDECEREIPNDEMSIMRKGQKEFCYHCYNFEIQQMIEKEETTKKNYFFEIQFKAIFYVIGMIVVAIFSDWFRFTSDNIGLQIGVIILVIPYYKLVWGMFVDGLRGLGGVGNYTEIEVTEYSDGRRETNEAGQWWMQFAMWIIGVFIRVFVVIAFGVLSPFMMIYFYYKMREAQRNINRYQTKFIPQYVGTPSDAKFNLQVYDFPYQLKDDLARHLQKTKKVSEIEAYNLLRNERVYVKEKVTIGEIYSEIVKINQYFKNHPDMRYSLFMEPIGGEER